MATKVELMEAAEKAKVVVDAALADTRTAMAEKDLSLFNRAMKNLGDKVKDWNKCLKKVAYAELLTQEHPVIAAVKQGDVKLKKVKEEYDKESGALMGVNIVDKDARIDLEDFCKFGELSTDWAKYATELLTLISVRETDVFAMPHDEVAKRSNYFAKVVRKKKEGETPDSNTQVVKLLQSIIDDAIFVDNGEGLNAYKCNNHDIAYITRAATKVSLKEKCTIDMIRERPFKALMLDVFAHCLGIATYKVNAFKPKAK